MEIGGKHFFIYLFFFNNFDNILINHSFHTVFIALLAKTAISYSSLCVHFVSSSISSADLFTSLLSFFSVNFSFPLGTLPSPPLFVQDTRKHRLTNITTQTKSGIAFIWKTIETNKTPSKRPTKWTKQALGYFSVLF